MLRAKPQTAITAIYCRKYMAVVRIVPIMHSIIKELWPTRACRADNEVL